MVALTAKRIPGTYRPATMMSPGERSSASQPARTFGFSSAVSSGCCTLAALLRAIQNSDESPTIAPNAPADDDGLELELSPCAASVEAALSVVSPGKIGMTASNQTSTKAQQVGQSGRRLGEPRRNVPCPRGAGAGRSPRAPAAKPPTIKAPRCRLHSGSSLLDVDRHQFSCHVTVGSARARGATSWRTFAMLRAVATTVRRPCRPFTRVNVNAGGGAGNLCRYRRVRESKDGSSRASPWRACRGGA